MLAYNIKITFAAVNVSLYNRISNDKVSELTLLSLLCYYFCFLLSSIFTITLKQSSSFLFPKFILVYIKDTICTFLGLICNVIRMSLH